MRTLALLLLLAPSLSAATFTVTSSADSGPGTFRQAILDANATPGRDQIVFTVATVVGTTAFPTITDVVDINGSVGSGRVDITGVMFNCSRAFHFQSGSSGSTLTRVRAEAFCESVHVDAGVSNVTITGNILGSVAIDGDDAVFGGTTPALGNTATFVTLTGDRNAITGNNLFHVAVYYAENNVISSNIVTHIQLEAAAGTRIEGNIMSVPPMATVTRAIEVTAALPTSSGVIIRGNSISGYQVGIVLHAEGGDFVSPTGVTITANSIFNTGLPIDLEGDGATPNDPAPDADTGANDLQNFPLLTTAVLSATQLTVSGTLASVPLTTYRIELFANAAGDPDARTFLGAFDVTTDAAGNAAFTRSVTTLPAADEVITSTATNLTTSETSEVSAAVAVDAPGQLGFAQPTYSVNESDGSIVVTVQRTGGSEGTVTVTFATENGSAVAPADYQPTSGTLTFGPGVVAQNITIPVVSDVFPEAAESFVVRLTGTTGGATLGQATTTVTIAAQAAPAGIPTLSEWSLLALALGLATVMFLRTR